MQVCHFFIVYTIGDGLAFGSDSPQFAVWLIGYNIEKSVCSLANVPNTLPTLGQHMFFANYTVIFNDQPHESLRSEPADEYISAPFRECFPRINLCSGGSDHWIPIVDWLFKSIFRGDASGDRVA